MRFTSSGGRYGLHLSRARAQRRAAHQYSNAIGRERLREASTGQRPVPTTANDLAARSSHRGDQSMIFACAAPSTQSSRSSMCTRPITGVRMGLPVGPCLDRWHLCRDRARLDAGNPAGRWLYRAGPPGLTRISQDTISGRLQRRTLALASTGKLAPACSLTPGLQVSPADQRAQPETPALRAYGLFTASHRAFEHNSGLTISTAKPAPIVRLLAWLCMPTGRVAVSCG